MEIVGKVTETREFRQTVMNTVGDRSSLDACEADLKRTRKELFRQRLMRFMTESRFWRKGSGS